MAQPSQGKGIHQTAERMRGSPSRPAAAGDDMRVSPLRDGTGTWVKACAFRTGRSAASAIEGVDRSAPLTIGLPSPRPSRDRERRRRSLVVGAARLSSVDRRGRPRSCRGRSRCSLAVKGPKTTKGRWLSSTVPSLGQLQRSDADRNCFGFSRRDTSSDRRAAHPCGSRSGAAARSRCRTGRRSRSPGRASPARRA